MASITAYQQLSHLVENGQLELVHVLGKPRSNGTALHLALTQAEECQGQVNEPFYYPDMQARKWDWVPSAGEAIPRVFDDGCEWILNAYQEKKREGLKKVVLVVHDLSQDLTAKEFRKLHNIVSHTVFVTRDPVKNALSMLTRYVNDTVSQPGGNKLSGSEVLEIASSGQNLQKFALANPDKISQELIRILSRNKDKELTREDYDRARQCVLCIFSHQFSVAWENFEHFLSIARHEWAPRRFTVFNGSWLFEKPEDSLRSLTARIGSLSFTPSMINGWTKGVGPSFNCIITHNWGLFEQVNNAWNGPVRNSRGIVIQKDSVSTPMPLSAFPTEVTQTIQNASRIYSHIHPAPTRPLNPTTLRRAILISGLALLALKYLTAKKPSPS